MTYRLITFLTVLTMMAPAAVAQKAQMDLTERLTAEGVAWELAEHRREMITDLRYDLTFRIPKQKTEPVVGQERMTFRLKRQEDVVLDFREAREKIYEVRVNGKACEVTMVNEHLIIPRAYIYKGGNMVEIEFTAGDQSLNRRDDLVYTLFVPDRARTAFPCFEQPNMKGRFTLTLDVPEEWTAVTNAPLTKKEKSEAGREILHFDETEPLSTYLFAFMAGEFNYQTYTEGGRTIGAYYRETDLKKVAQLPEIFRQVMFALKWLEDFTVMEYPFRKYDLVILPGFQFGGMEHTGATFYNDNTLFLADNPTQDEVLKRAQLIAHETAHMWFGDAVTMNWFDDVWTKEVFANYFAAEITEPLFPDVDHELNWLKTTVASAIAQDRTEGRTSIRQRLDNLRFAGLVYNNIIYNKAPVMMKKMVAMMGKEAFRRGIQKYVKTYKYGNATWDDLIRILDAETKADLKTFSRDWVDTPNWPVRKATTARDALDMEYYGFTECSAAQIDSLFHGGMVKSDAELQRLLMSLYENYLNDKMHPEALVRAIMNMLPRVKNPLVFSSLLSYLGEPLDEVRRVVYKGDEVRVEALERSLWNIMEALPERSAQRKQVLRSIMANAVSRVVTDSLFSLWKEHDKSVLSANDYMTLSYELAIRLPEKADSIIAAERSRLTDPDRLRQFDFISRAVSSSQQKRDELFESLKKAENRRIEPWTLSVLYYLNHPLRQKEAVKYIRPALELLPELQRTGDIFFPGSWCRNLLAGHRSSDALREVNGFLASHPDLLPLLRNKVLEARYYINKVNSEE